MPKRSADLSLIEKDESMLTNVTLTGADDTIDPREIIALSKEFPFAEFGILIGSKGGARMPSLEWIERLLVMVTEVHPHYVPLSLHVCGNPLRQVLQEGRLPDVVDVGDFHRMQLNIRETVGEEVVPKIAAMQAVLHVQEIIIRIDHLRNEWLLDALLYRGVKASALFDRSHGAGVKPDVWPTANPAWEVGYAGGLGALNIARELPEIIQAARGQRFWIDMETSLFKDGKFDAWQCRCVLEYCAAWIGRKA
jgi:hypothetical protein